MLNDIQTIISAFRQLQPEGIPFTRVLTDEERKKEFPITLAAWAFMNDKTQSNSVAKLSELRAVVLMLSAHPRLYVGGTRMGTAEKEARSITISVNRAFHGGGMIYVGGPLCVTRDQQNFALVPKSNKFPADGYVPEGFYRDALEINDRSPLFLRKDAGTFQLLDLVAGAFSSLDAAQKACTEDVFPIQDKILVPKFLAVLPDGTDSFAINLRPSSCDKLHQLMEELCRNGKWKYGALTQGSTGEINDIMLSAPHDGIVIKKDGEYFLKNESELIPFPPVMSANSALERALHSRFANRVDVLLHPVPEGPVYAGQALFLPVPKRNYSVTEMQRECVYEYMRQLAVISTAQRHGSSWYVDWDFAWTIGEPAVEMPVTTFNRAHLIQKRPMCLTRTTKTFEVELFKVPARVRMEYLRKERERREEAAKANPTAVVSQPTPEFIPAPAPVYAEVPLVMEQHAPAVVQPETVPEGLVDMAAISAL